MAKCLEKIRSLAPFSNIRGFFVKQLFNWSFVYSYRHNLALCYSEMADNSTTIPAATATLTDTEVLSLGDRMKSYEKPTAMVLDPSKPFIIRIDGHKFSSYTRPFNKPFDDRSICYLSILLLLSWLLIRLCPQSPMQC